MRARAYNRFCAAGAVELSGVQLYQRHDRATLKASRCSRFALHCPSPDAQAWLALSNLLLDADCRAKYRLDDFRTTALLGLRSALTEVSTAHTHWAAVVLRQADRDCMSLTEGLGIIGLTCVQILHGTSCYHGPAASMVLLPVLDCDNLLYSWPVLPAVQLKMDQLPPLRALRGFLEELAVVHHDTPAEERPHRPHVVLEEVAVCIIAGLSSLITYRVLEGARQVFQPVSMIRSSAQAFCQACARAGHARDEPTWVSCCK